MQSLLGHAKLERTVCYLGVEVEDALEISEQPEVYFLRVGRGRGVADRRPN